MVRTTSSLSSQAPRRLPLWSLLALIGWAVGCAGTTPVVVAPGQDASLGAEDGLLVVQVSTDVALRTILLGRVQVATNLPSGDHLWLIRLPAGRYSWSSVDLGPGIGSGGRINVSQMTASRREEFAIEVHAGALNYPGDLILRANRVGRSSGHGISLRNRNHSAMAIRRLRKRYSKILDVYPIRYAGMSGDGFLDFFTREKQSSE